MHSVWLKSVDWSKRANAAVSIRSARKVLGYVREANGLQDAMRMVQVVHETGEPQIVGQTPDKAAAEEAVACLGENGALDLTPEDQIAIAAGNFTPEPEPTPEPPKLVSRPEVYRVALVLMAAANGNPLNTFIQARMLGYHAPDREFYRDVQRVCHLTWPHLSNALKEAGVNPEPT